MSKLTTALAATVLTLTLALGAFAKGQDCCNGTSCCSGKACCKSHKK
jgi:hypothetical protein